MTHMKHTTCDIKEVGDALRAKRLAMNLSQSDLGALVGMSRATINRVENGAMEFRHLFILCKELGLKFSITVVDMAEQQPKPSRGGIPPRPTSTASWNASSKQWEEPNPVGVEWERLAAEARAAGCMTSKEINDYVQPRRRVFGPEEETPD